MAQVIERLPNNCEALSSNSSITKKKKIHLLNTIFAFARHQWLTPVILATQEAEIRRIMVQSQLGK
jgi:hypothetical protein